MSDDDFFVEGDYGITLEDKTWGLITSNIKKDGYRAGLSDGEEESLQTAFNETFTLSSTLLYKVAQLRGRAGALLTLHFLKMTSITDTQHEQLLSLIGDVVTMETQLLSLPRCSMETLQHRVRTICSDAELMHDMVPSPIMKEETTDDRIITESSGSLPLSQTDAQPSDNLSEDAGSLPSSQTGSKTSDNLSGDAGSLPWSQTGSQPSDNLSEEAGSLPLSGDIGSLPLSQTGSQPSYQTPGQLSGSISYVREAVSVAEYSKGSEEHTYTCDGKEASCSKKDGLSELNLHKGTTDVDGNELKASTEKDVVACMQQQIELLQAKFHELQTMTSDMIEV